MNPNEIASIIRRLAPEFGTLPLYILVTATVPELLTRSDFAGFCAPGLDLIFKPRIEQWQGRGPTLFVNNELLRQQVEEYYAGRSQPEIDRHYAATVIAVACHEAAHALDSGLETYRDRAAGPANCPTETDSLLAALAGRPPEQPLPSEHEHHGPRWIRAAVHLWHRCRRLPIRPHLDSVFNAEAYRLPSHAGCYARRLVDECEQMANRPFAEILASPMPKPFAELWAADAQARQLTLSAKEPTL